MGMGMTLCLSLMIIIKLSSTATHAVSGPDRPSGWQIFTRWV
jgi:hypothetical protein